MLERLTSAQFLGVLQQRGYSLAQAARLFGISGGRMTQVVHDPNRPMHWDFALWGLPPRAWASANFTKRQEFARKHSAAAILKRPQASSATLNKIATPEHELRDIWVVKESPGDHLPFGCEGIVSSIKCIEDEFYLQLTFPSTGYEEAFAVSYLTDPSCFLAPTGRRLD